MLVGLCAGLEPGVFLAGMAGHEVEQHVHAALMGLVEQRHQIVVGAVARGDHGVIAYVVAPVLEGGIEARIDPQGVASQIVDIVETLNDARNVTDAIGIAVLEALRVDLVKYRGIKPFRAVDAYVILHLFPYKT